MQAKAWFFPSLLFLVLYICFIYMFGLVCSKEAGGFHEMGYNFSLWRKESSTHISLFMNHSYEREELRTSHDMAQSQSHMDEADKMCLQSLLISRVHPASLCTSQKQKCQLKAKMLHPEELFSPATQVSNTQINNVFLRWKLEHLRHQLLVLALHIPELWTGWSERSFPSLAGGRCWPRAQHPKFHFPRRPPRWSLRWWPLPRCCRTCSSGGALGCPLSSACPAPAAAARPRACSPPGTSAACCSGAAFSVSGNISWDILCFPRESRVCSQRDLPEGNGTTASAALLSPEGRRRWSLIMAPSGSDHHCHKSACKMRGTASAMLPAHWFTWGL